MAHHVPDQPARFLCKSADMLQSTANTGDQRQRREVEANRFATLALMPPHLLQGAMATFGEPDLQHVLGLARDFAVGKEVAARAYVQYHPGRIAVVVAGNGRVQRRYRSLYFPDITCGVNSPVPFTGIVEPTDGRSSPGPPMCKLSLWSGPLQLM